MKTLDHITQDAGRAIKLGKEIDTRFIASALTALTTTPQDGNWYSLNGSSSFAIIEFPLNSDKVKVCGDSFSSRTRTYSEQGYINALAKEIGDEEFRTAMQAVTIAINAA